MTNTAKSRVRQVGLTLIAAVPWILAMYLFFWLDSSGTWTTETPHRGKLSVMILGAGMVATFLLYSRLVYRR